MKTLETLVAWIMCLGVLLTTFGCHRSYYRRQADTDARRLIQEKSLDPHWSIPGYTIDVDPTSRMFDPFSIDHPPMPPDDSAAAEFMHTVDGKPGFPHWHANGDTPNVANPEWRHMLPVDQDGKLVVDLNLAVELALLHSPDYQRQLENLYFSALAVSLERFDFESQFFAPFRSTMTSSGRVRGGGASSTTVLNSNGVGSQLRKAGITGSNLIVGFANSILWQFSGSNTTVGFGSLSLELIQPLLRNAGRDVILESLTDAERGLLYNVRQLERFRRGYMQQIAVGINNGGGVSVGSGSIVSVPGVSQGPGGVLGLLQTQQSIRIQEANIESQRNLLEQFEEFFRFQRIDLLQLKQFKDSVYGSQSGLLSSKASYQSSLDDFKITLGLPPDIELEVRDPILDQFVLIDPKITNRKDELNGLRARASSVFLDITEIIAAPIEKMKIAREAIQANGGDPDVDLSWTNDDIPFDQAIQDRIQQARETLEKIKPIYEKIVKIDFPQTEADIQQLEDSLQRRQRSLQALQKQLKAKSSGDSGVPVIEPEVLDTGVLETLVPERKIEFRGGVRTSSEMLPETVTGVQASLAQARAQLDEHLRRWDLILANGGKLPDSELNAEPLKSQLGVGGDVNLKIAVKTRAGTIKRFISEPGPEVLTILNNLITDVSLIQALARVDSLTLPVVDIDWKNAMAIARANRRDWMNARAQLVDQWRNIEVVADRLESQLDLIFGADLQNVTDNPLKLRGSNGQIRVGVQFDAPITRLAERNSYRSTLIGYQQTKRRYYQFEDQVAAQIREIIRLLEVVKLNFEISRIQVKNSVDEVQLASYNLVRPPAPGSTSSRVGGQTANNLIRALRNLLNNQNSLIRNWTQYEVLRRQLDFNMGTMQLDENGFWIDPVEMTLESIEGTLSGESLPEPDLPPNAEGNSQKVPGTPLPPLAFESKPDREVWASYEDWPDRRSTNQQVKVPNSGRMSNRTGRLIPAGERIPKTTSGSLYSNFNRDRQEASRLQRLPKGTGQVSGKSTRPATTSQRFRHLERGMNTVRYNDALIPPRISPFPFRVPNH
ncbi:MAG: hypothetical protein VX438_03575 [Planctomycetota bacterium]|nr:hypothetical protein [Planctomycetota bacterium]